MIDYAHTILRAVLDAADAGESVIMATVVKVSGSAPCHSVAKLVIYESGQLVDALQGTDFRNVINPLPASP
jgi:xanthine/CO dehydrogenase XdhC/CoxF family maturation factor